MPAPPPPRRPKLLTEVLNVRLTAELSRLLDEEVEHETRSHGGAPVTRANLARQLLAAELQRRAAKRRK